MKEGASDPGIAIEQAHERTLVVTFGFGAVAAVALRVTAGVASDGPLLPGFGARVPVGSDGLSEAFFSMVGCLFNNAENNRSRETQP